MKSYLFLLVFIIIIDYVYSSAGDQSVYYQRCVDNCRRNNCTADGLSFVKDTTQSIYLIWMHWTCVDECKYECMWKTVNAFHERKWKTPQFHGKWPFIRFLGLQEPASVLFSLLNFYAHFLMLRVFRKSVESDSPFYWLWHAFSLVGLNTWFWSTIFHARDFPYTEYMDYISGYGLVLMTCYCMCMRLLWNAPRLLLIIVTTFFLSFFINHLVYLSMERFDYSYNMLINIMTGLLLGLSTFSYCQYHFYLLHFITEKIESLPIKWNTPIFIGIIPGTITAIFWFTWCIYNRKRQPYVWKCAVFVTLTGLFMLLEIIDRPPILWIFDLHSLWHLTTAPLICLFYSFIIDDCRYLRKLKYINRDKRMC